MSKTEKTCYLYYQTVLTDIDSMDSKNYAQLLILLLGGDSWKSTTISLMECTQLTYQLE